MIKDYEMVIGLEVHAELKTASKIFCGCSTAFGAEPNTQCCPVCTGMPGSLPVLNRRVAELAIKAGLAANCEINLYSKQDRKNYFYPDLPKAYQISQYDLPLCKNGYLDISTTEGEKRIGITRIHIEEDAGKLVHTPDGGTMCDYNRCGVPLIEIVSEPDIRSAEEAKAYLQKLRAVLMYTEVSDCKMQEGSLRCDVNLSVRKKGADKLGTRTEMKNLNSFSYIVKAIEYEYERQINEIEAGGAIVQETRRFDPTSGKTFSMRKKEDANDYRYFPDPDLIPIVTSKEELDRLQAEIPELPDSRKAVYIKKLGLGSAVAEQLVTDKQIADYFEAAAGLCGSPKLLANLITSEVFRLRENDESLPPIAPKHIAEIADMLAAEKISHSAAKKLLQLLWENDEPPATVCEREKLWQISDRAYLEEVAKKVVAADQKSVEDYKNGKDRAIKALLGKAMRETAGQANPKILNDIMLKVLGEQP